MLDVVKDLFRNGFKAVRNACERVSEKVRADRRLCFFLRLGARYALVVLALGLYTVIISRAAQAKAIKTYEGWFIEWQSTQEQAAEQAKAEALAADPYERQLDEEAEALAKVLYGVKDNDSEDLKTYCWCVFNRVENKAFPDTLEDVIGQPSQWMRYDVTNPILEPLFKLARAELDRWHTDNHRPVSSDYVFMNWTKNDICLRDNFYEGSGTHYWRWNQ